MKNWPDWLPQPSSWISAFFLTILIGVLETNAEKILELGRFLTNGSIRGGIFFGLLAMLSPIIFIAFLHHFFHALFDSLFPNTSSPELGKVEGLMPYLLSWWEGLFAWVVLVLTTIITLSILGVFVSSTSDLFRMFSSWDHIKHIFTKEAMIWMVTATFIYHFEYLVRQRLLSVGYARSNRS